MSHITLLQLPETLLDFEDQMSHKFDIQTKGRLTHLLETVFVVYKSERGKKVLR